MDSSTLPIPAEIRSFLENLLTEAQISPEPELKESMVDGLYQRLQARLMQVLAENFEEADLNQYAELADQSQEKAVEFLASKNPNLPVLFQQAMEEFKQKFLEK